MANEISAAIVLRALKNSAKVDINLAKSNDMAGNIMFQSVQTIGTSTEQIVIPSDLTGVPGWFAIANLDGTNFVQIGLDTPVTQIFAKLLAGQMMLFPPGSATMYAKADTASVNIQVAGIML